MLRTRASLVMSLRATPQRVLDSNGDMPVMRHSHGGPSNVCGPLCDDTAQPEGLPPQWAPPALEIVRRSQDVHLEYGGVGGAGSHRHAILAHRSQRQR